MTAPLRLTDEHRRALLVARHRLDRTAPSPEIVTRGLVVLHSSDPSTPYLSCRARMSGFDTADLDRALFLERTLWRLHAMRRTLFVATRDDGHVLRAAATRDVARAERTRIEKMVASSLPIDEPAPWIADLEASVLAQLHDGRARSTQDLTAAIPGLGREVEAGSGRWARSIPLSSRLLLLLAMDGRIVRGRPAGSWRSSQYAWADADAWFEDRETDLDPRAAKAALAGRYLDRYGPVTLEDLRWWTGWGARASATAADDAGAVAVSVGSREALVLASDLESPRRAQVDQTAVALLPALDPTPMGWREREWYLCDGSESLFDQNGNVGPSVWVAGRVVGGWATDGQGEVRVRLLVDVGREASRRIAEEAARLAEWLDGTSVTPRFRTPIERELVA